MAVYFLDSTALVKRSFQEKGTAWVRQLTDVASGNRIFVARLTLAETAAALMRSARSGKLDPASAVSEIDQLRSAFACEYRVIEMTSFLVTQAVNHVQLYALRGSDALQLAAATELNRRRASEGLPSLTFISTDPELNAAARAEGLLVEDPNDQA